MMGAIPVLEKLNHVRKYLTIIDIFCMNRCSFSSFLSDAMEQTCLDDGILEQIKEFRHIKYHRLSSEQKSLVDKLIINKDLKKRYQRFALCGECWQVNTGLDWCHSCNSNRFQKD